MLLRKTNEINEKLKSDFKLETNWFHENHTLLTLVNVAHVPGQ